MADPVRRVLATLCHNREGEGYRALSPWSSLIRAIGWLVLSAGFLALAAAVAVAYVRAPLEGRPAVAEWISRGGSLLGLAALLFVVGTGTTTFTDGPDLPPPDPGPSPARRD